MLAFLTNLGLPEIIVILVIAVLIFGKDLPQAASKAYLHVRKLRNAVDDLRRDSGIDRELRNIERTVREAEWEAKRAVPRSQELALGAAPKADAPRTPRAPEEATPVSRPEEPLPEEKAPVEPEKPTDPDS